MIPQSWMKREHTLPRWSKVWFRRILLLFFFAFNQSSKTGNQSSLKLWQEFRDLSIAEYKKIYGRLGISFDEYSGESIAQKGVPKVMELLKAKNLLVEKEGAKVVDLSKYSLGTVVLEKSDGSTLYLTRDIGQFSASFPGFLCLD
jgi:arginyl-tRNA synthetase